MAENTEKSKQRVIQNTWWKDTKNRIWLIHSVWFNNGNPVTITLLELGKSESLDQPYELIQEYIEENKFKPLTT